MILVGINHVLTGSTLPDAWSNTKRLVKRRHLAILGCGLVQLTVVALLIALNAAIVVAAAWLMVQLASSAWVGLGIFAVSLVCLAASYHITLVLTIGYWLSVYRAAAAGETAAASLLTGRNVRQTHLAANLVIVAIGLVLVGAYWYYGRAYLAPARHIFDTLT
jgi:hypothetical protein